LSWLTYDIHKQTSEACHHIPSRIKILKREKRDTVFLYPHQSLSYTPFQTLHSHNYPSMIPPSTLKGHKFLYLRHHRILYLLLLIPSSAMKQELSYKTNNYLERLYKLGEVYLLFLHIIDIWVDIELHLKFVDVAFGTDTRNLVKVLSILVNVGDQKCILQIDFGLALHLY